jgi:cytidylate kinase
MRARQRELSQLLDCVMEGRDIGSVVAPQAELKIYLVADEQERVRRRLIERPAATAEELIARDASDAERMERAADAIELDTTGLTVDEVVQRIAALLRERAA